MPNSFPFAIQLIGFKPQEIEIFDATFALDRGTKYGYFRLAEDNLQDPDLYLANAENLKALVILSDLSPSDVRPVLLVGKPIIPLPYARVEHPIRWYRLFDGLDKLVEKRADTLARLEASDIISVPERRRQNRVDIDLTDPADYQNMRTTLQPGGAILVVDKSPSFRDYVAELLPHNELEIIWVDTEMEAAVTCARQRIAAVLINTSVIDINPYRLCKRIKHMRARNKTAVILLVSKASEYDLVEARGAESDGFLIKPVASSHLLNALKKFMLLPR